jgi:hypothetical protein
VLCVFKGAVKYLYKKYLILSFWLVGWGRLCIPLINKNEYGPEALLGQWATTIRCIIKLESFKQKVIYSGLSDELSVVGC